MFEPPDLPGLGGCGLVFFSSLAGGSWRFCWWQFAARMIGGFCLKDEGV